MAVLINRQRKVHFSVKWVRGFFLKAEKILDVKEDSVTVVFLSDERIAELNRQWRGVDGPTDCLSFPMQEEDDPFSGGYLGDIAISLETAERQASIYFPEHSDRDALVREVTVLFVHSVLHLLGYDHDTPEKLKEMASKENYILSQLFPGEDVKGLEARIKDR